MTTGINTSVIGTTSSSSTSSTASTTNWQQKKSDFQSLSQALKSGNLDAAKAAYAQLAKDDPNAVKNANSPLAQIGSDLQSGNLSGAQQAFSALHNGRHGGSSSASASSTSTSNPTDTLGNNVDALA